MASYYDDCVTFMLAKAHQTAHGISKKKLEPFGLTPKQYLILEVLWEEEGLVIGEISKRISIDYATLSSLLDRMARNGWIRKDRNPEDKRVWLVCLTEKSKEKKEALLVEQEAANRQMTASFSEAEKLLLFRMLKELRLTDSSLQPKDDKANNQK